MLPAARLIEFSALKMRKTEQKVASEKVTETQQRMFVMRYFTVMLDR